MRKQFPVFSTIISFVMLFSPLPVIASEYSELHCPTIIKVEDSLGNVYNGSGIQGSFIKGSVNTITVKITATDPQGLPLHYQFLFGGWMKVDGTEMTNWVTENTATLDVSNANAGANQSNWIRVDNQDGYGCIGAYYDTQAHFMYDVYPPETSCLSFTYSDWGTCSDSGQQPRSIISSSPNGCIGGTPILSQSCTPAPKTCTSFIYSDWSSCSSEGQQTRSTNSFSPSGCTGGSPVLTQSCTYVPTVCTSWTYSNWSLCSSNGQQTRSVISSSPNGCSGGNPALTQSCAYTPPTCTSWEYSIWSACSNNQQSRTVTASQPASCTGGTPVLTQSCDSTPLCKEDNWTSTLTPTVCPSNGQQTKKWTKIGECKNGTTHPAEEIAGCDYQVPTCLNFTYSDWDACSASGVQSRTKLSATPSGCTGGNLTLNRTCDYVPSCNSDAWVCEDWGSCSSNRSQVRTCTKTFDCPNIQTPSPVMKQSCEIQKDTSQQKSTNNSVEVLNKDSNKDMNSNLSVPSIKNDEQKAPPENKTGDSQVVEQRKSEVASAVQEILQLTKKDNGIGQQVKTITQTQTQNQEKLETSLQKVQSRSGLTKFFVGPDYGEINNAKKLLEQNREQIKQLDKVKAKLASQNDKQKLTEQVQLIEQTNQQIENFLNTSQKGFSLFGWVFRLFTTR